MRKCQPCEIQVRLQDELVHHDLMTGDTFLSFSELMVLSVLAVLTAINQLLFQENLAICEDSELLRN